MTPKNIVIAGLAALALLFAGLYFFASPPQLFGSINVTGPLHYQAESFLQGVGFGARNQSQFDNAGKLTVGASGSAITNYLFGSCNPTQMAPGSQGATSSAVFFCPVSGVSAGDKINVDMPSLAGTTYGGFVAVNAFATTTGIIAFTLDNFTGAATSSFVQATSGVEYFDWR